MPMPTPPLFLNSNTRIVCFSLPSDGVKVISNTPGFEATKSVALYCNQRDTDVKLQVTASYRSNDLIYASKVQVKM